MQIIICQYLHKICSGAQNWCIPLMLWIYMCVCTCIHMYVYMYMYTHIHVYMYMYIYMCICTCIHMYVYMYMYLHVYIHVCMYMYTHVDIYSYVHSHVHIHIHVNKFLFLPWRICSGAQNWGVPPMRCGCFEVSLYANASLMCGYLVPVMTDPDLLRVYICKSMFMCVYTYI